MKKLSMVLRVLVILGVVLVAGLFVFFKCYNFDQFRPVIVAKAQEAVGRNIELSKIELNFKLKDGFVLALKGIKLPDDKLFDNPFLVELDSVEVGVKIWPLIVQRQLVVTHLVLSKPVIHFIMLADGSNNFTYLAQQLNNKPTTPVPSQAQSQGQPQPNTKPSTNVSNAPAAMPNIVVTNIRVDNGSVLYAQKQTAGPLALAINNINVQVNDFGLDKWVPFKASVDILTKGQPLVSAEGGFKIDLKTSQISLHNIKVKIDSSQLDMDGVKKLCPQIDAAKLKASPKVMTLVDVDSLDLSPQGLSQLVSRATIDDGSIATEWLKDPISNIKLRAEVNEKDALVKEVSLDLAQGHVTVDADVKDYLKTQTLSGIAEVKAVDLGELTSIFKMPFKLAGKINGKMTMSGVGIANLGANGDARVDGMKILDFNLLKFVLDQVSFIPNLGAKAEANLAEKYKNYLGSKDTEFEMVSSDLQFANNKLVFSKGLVKAQGFEVNFNGDMDLTQNLNFAMDMYMDAELSGELLGSSPDLKYLLQQDGRMHFPFKPYQGPAVKFKIFPDLKDVAKNYINNRGKEEIKGLIYKALKINPQESSGQPAQPAGTTSEPQNEKPGKDLINGLLDKILK
ncbi:MAG: AsmA family protein [Candidatus Omnitrophica bacterium]|nr:AsmA family protein [Candidatus Omnitrophota bacterium]